jgi:hypothetical protein
MKVPVPIWVVIIVLTFAIKSQAQSRFLDSINQKIQLYNLKNPKAILFAHFDKTVYMQNENAWFTAYLTNADSTDNASILSAALVNEANRVVLERQFLMVDGIAPGNILLTDTIPAGNYNFILFTNQLFKGKPKNVFSQAITIVNTSESTFKASLSLDTTTEYPDKREVTLNAVSKDGTPIPGALVSYHMTNNNHDIFKGSAKTNELGRYLIDIPATGGDGNVLEAQVKYNKDIQSLKLIVPFKKKPISVRFYPEGGYLVHATPGWVGWEAKVGELSPVKTTAILYKDNHPVDTIETDSYGMGRFKLIPLIGNSYTVKLVSKEFRDSVFKLPEMLPKGPVISITNALANDTLKIRLTSKFPTTATVLVHDYRQLFYSFHAEPSATGKIILIVLKNVPKGLATITVLDSAGRPCAERLFFAHYNKRSIIDIQTDKPKYAKRDNIKLTLKFRTAATGLVSIACVQSNRLQIKNSNDIESYRYLKQELGMLPLKENYMGNNEQDKTYLENVLLIKGWRRYTWQEMMKTIPADTISNRSLLTFSGQITHSGKPINKPMRLVVMTDSATTTVRTDNAGTIILNNDLILTDQNKQVHFLLMDRNKENYELRVDNPFIKINKTLLASTQPEWHNIDNTNQSEIKGLEHAIALKEVTIHARNDNSLLNTSSAGLKMPTENECGDYICMYGIFNCPNHKGWFNNIIPKVGEYYIMHDGIKQRYMGCAVPIVKNQVYFSAIDGIKYSKEFYGSDYSVVNPSQPEYYSTIFWKHLVQINSSTEVKFSFYASDITGEFKVIVQGVTNDDVVYGESQFDIK